MSWTLRAALALGLASCGGRLHAPAAATTGDAVTLYRDRAVVRQRVEIVVPPGGVAATRVAVKVAAGMAPRDLQILDRGGLVVSALRVADAVVISPAHDAASAAPADTPDDAAADVEVAPEASAPDAPDAQPLVPADPAEVELTVAAPHPGRFTLWLGYVTDRLAWQAAYTMTTSAARDRATLRGALAIRSTAGVALSGHTRVVDAALGAWRAPSAAQLDRALAGATTAAPPRDLGMLALGDGETRVELLAGTAPRKMRSVLVYDPIGTALDHPGSAPVSDPALGAAASVAVRVTESFEVERDERAAAGLPAGPVQLLERRPDGSLALLGEARLFDAATRLAGVDSVAIGAADAVVGHRERRDWARDDVQRRFSEEFLLTIDNARPRPVEIVLREHLYRGQNWTLAYQSAPAAKEGPQQIALRTTVPANGTAKVLYVVVYTW